MDLNDLAAELEVQAEAAKAQASELQDQAKRLVEAARTLRFGSPKATGPRKQRRTRRTRKPKGEPDKPRGESLAVLRASGVGAREEEREKIADGERELAHHTSAGQQDG